MSAVPRGALYIRDLLNCHPPSIQHRALACKGNRDCIKEASYSILKLEAEVMDITDLLDKTRRYIPEEKLPLIEEAYEFAAHAHEGQVRKSGEPFLEHPLQTAVILADLQLEAVTLAAALLHDVPEGCGVSLEEIERRFGSEVRKVVAE